MVVMETIGARLERFVGSAFPSKAAFARQLGWDPASATKYFKGKQEPGKVLLKKLLELGCNLAWLQTGHGDMYAANPAGKALRERAQGATVEVVAEEMAVYRVKRDRHMLPLFLTPVRAGMAPPMGDDEEGFEMVNLSDEIRLPRDGAWMLEVQGESMVDDNIRPGDRLIVSKVEPASGDVVVAAYNGSPTVKRLRQKGQAVWLYPSSPDHHHQPIKVVPDDTLVIWGVVHAIIHIVQRQTNGW